MPRFLYFPSAFAINSQSRIFSTGRIDDPMIDDRAAFYAIAYGGYQMAWSPTSAGYSAGSMSYAMSPGIVLTGNQLANVLNGSNGDDTINGLGGNDSLNGFGGDDTLDGGPGADFMRGGAGNDIYIVDNVGDIAGESHFGIDTVRASVSFSMVGRKLEHLELTGSGHINGIGNVGFNTIIGNAGRNALDGGANEDTLDGRGGNDTLNGGQGHDTLNGGDGNDVLRGSTGYDTLDGGVGNFDEADYSDRFAVAVVVTLNGAGNVSTVTVGGVAEDTIRNIEGVIGGGAADALTGNNLANRFYGGGGNDTLHGAGNNDTLDGHLGNDTLDGGTGADIMRGGDGDDLYIVDNAGDTAWEKSQSGIDTVRASVSFSMAGRQLEHLELTGSGHINGIGNSKVNTMIGNAGRNALDGGTGNDTLNGRAGKDTLTGDTGADTFVFDTALQATNVDTITDFSVADDTLSLDDAVSPP
jgi:Ca2+-binding RTX toxin-like protein